MDNEKVWVLKNLTKFSQGIFIKFFLKKINFVHPFSKHETLLTKESSLLLLEMNFAI